MTYMLPSPARTRSWHAQKQCRLRQGRVRGGGDWGGQQGWGSGKGEGEGEWTWPVEEERGGRGVKRGGSEGERAMYVPLPSLALFPLPSSLSCYLPGASDPHPPPPCQPHGVFWARVHAGNSKAVSTKPVKRDLRQEEKRK